jgi:hypothetical protein
MKWLPRIMIGGVLALLVKAFFGWPRAVRMLECNT